MCGRSGRPGSCHTRTPAIRASADRAREPADGHFHPKGKPPSKHTLKVLREAHAALPFSDTMDFEEEQKGFIAAPKSWRIMANAGNVAWDMER